MISPEPLARYPSGDAIQANLKVRREVVRRGFSDPDFAEAMRMICAKDVLAFINLFCWTYDPRLVESPVVPFVTYPCQDVALISMERCIREGEDVLIEKSRDMGATWLALAVMLHAAQFRDMQTFLLASRKEQLVDETENPDSLFWRLRFLIRNQPSWLRPTLTKDTYMSLVLKETGSAFNGESTNADLSRGGRRTAIMLDEFSAVPNGYEILSATADATRCRIFNSTPAGVGNAFYSQTKLVKNKIRLHWSDHPVKARGLYFVNGKPRSPWYDRECERRHPREIAEQLDIDYHGSDYLFFEADVIESVLLRDCRPPIGQYTIDYDPVANTVRSLVQSGLGYLKVWTPIGLNGLPLARPRVACGCDVAVGSVDASGRGASNHAASFGEIETGRKIAEIVLHGWLPEAFADLVIAACRIFEDETKLGVYLVWEANGPGTVFGNRIRERGYSRVYYRTDERKMAPKPTDMPGWYSSTENKVALLSDYRSAMKTGKFVNPSRYAVEECRSYVHGVGGKVGHSVAMQSTDPTDSRDGHGDVVIADALCWKGIKLQGGARWEEAQQPQFNLNSVGGRILERERRRKALDATGFLR